MVSIRPAEVVDYPSIVDYFRSGSDAFLSGMGVERSKLPDRDVWLKLLGENHELPIERKNLYYLIWFVNDEPIGHSNINKIIFGDEAYMHLHMWKPDVRTKGYGFKLINQCLPEYFNTFNLKRLWCEPYALNPAPNKTLKRAGFTLIKTYDTIPGLISFHQPVNRWCMTRDEFNQIHPPDNSPI